MSQYIKKALVLGAGGFIGSHMVKRLRAEGYWVRGVDLKLPEYSESEAHEFVIGDLRDLNFVERTLQYKGPYRNFYNFVPSRYIETFDEIYQFAADMGGAGFVFTGDNDADIMHNSATINLNVLEAQRQLNDFKGVNKTKILFGPGAPVTWFIDEDGKVVNKHIGAYTDRDQLFTQVEQAFGVKL